MNLRHATRALAILLASAAFQAQADTTAITVRAQVLEKCRISSSNHVIELPIDPSSTEVVIGNRQIDFKCTKGTPFKVSLKGNAMGSAVRSELKSQGKAIGYSLNASSTEQRGLGFGPTSGVKLLLSATVDPQAFADAEAGSYQDDITVDITP